MAPVALPQERSYPSLRVGEASPPLSVALSASTNGTDVGRALDLEALPRGGVPPYETTWSDSSGDVAVGPTWSLAPPTVGNVTVAVVATDASGAVAFAHATFPVAGPPNVTIDPAPLFPGSDGDALLDGSITGGTAPYTALLSVPATGYNASFRVSRSGPFSAPARVGDPGGAIASLVVTDAVDATASVERSLSVIPLPPLVVTVTPATVRADAGQRVHLLLLIAGAVAPATYSIASAQPLENATAPGGAVPSNGTLAWSGAFDGPGNDSIVVSVRDGAGRSASGTGTVLVAAALSAFLAPTTASPRLGTNLTCRVTIAGGTPPYAWLLSTSAGTAATGNASSPGSFDASVAANALGELALRLEVWDGWGEGVGAPANVTVASDGAPDPGVPGAPSTTGDDTALYGIPIAAVGGAALASLLWWRRSVKRSDARSPAPEALREVRRLLAGNALLDRETLSFLAEEQGLARADAEEALERWVRSGRVRVEHGDDGTDRFRWTEPKDEENPLEEVP